jgi:hypothetical protein
MYTIDAAYFIATLLSEFGAALLVGTWLLS